MNILLVSWYMPPYNTMGALRVGKFAHYLAGAGHDVRVLAGSGLPFPQTLPLEFPEDRIIRTPYRDINDPLRALNRMLFRLRGSGGHDGEAPAGDAGAENRSSNGAGVLRRMRQFYQEVTNFPDSQVTWRFTAVRGAVRALDGWRPDIIFASAPPFTSLMVGRRLSRLFSTRWVAEYRDRYAESNYRNLSSLRRAADRKFEDWLLHGVSGIVTVSEPWADDYRARYRLPVACIYNGFDPVQFPAEFPRRTNEPDVLRIVYTGILYTGRRDPSPLFEAIARMGDAGKQVRVAFYGADNAVLHAMAERHGILDEVELNGNVPYGESVAAQMNADILLLLQWNDPSEAGNLPGKLFEYIGARRPVLGIGYEQGIAARILRERDVGVVLNDSDAIAERLAGWLETKRREGSIPLLPEAARHGLSRPEQYEKLEKFLSERVAAPAE